MRIDNHSLIHHLIHQSMIKIVQSNNDKDNRVAKNSKRKLLEITVKINRKIACKTEPKQKLKQDKTKT